MDSTTFINSLFSKISRFTDSVHKYFPRNLGILYFLNSCFSQKTMLSDPSDLQIFFWHDSLFSSPNIIMGPSLAQLLSAYISQLSLGLALETYKKFASSIVASAFLPRDNVKVRKGITSKCSRSSQSPTTPCWRSTWRVRNRCRCGYWGKEVCAECILDLNFNSIEFKFQLFNQFWEERASPQLRDDPVPPPTGTDCRLHQRWTGIETLNILNRVTAHSNN